MIELTLKQYISTTFYENRAWIMEFSLNVFSQTLGTFGWQDFFIKWSISILWRRILLKVALYVKRSYIWENWFFFEKSLAIKIILIVDSFVLQIFPPTLNCSSVRVISIRNRSFIQWYVFDIISVTFFDPSSVLYSNKELKTPNK